MASVISAVASMGQLFAVTIAAFVAYAQFRSFRQQQVHLRQAACLEDGRVVTEMLAQALSALRMASNSPEVMGRKGKVFESTDAVYFKAVANSFLNIYSRYEKYFLDLREFRARAVVLELDDSLIRAIDVVVSLTSELKFRLDAFCNHVQFASATPDYPRERWDNIAASMLNLPNFEEDKSRIVARMRGALDEMAREIQNAMRGVTQ